MHKILVLVVLVSSSALVVAQDKPHKYALLAAVREYEHPDMNQPILAFPEVDAKSMNDLLKESGYEVDLLLGKQATQANIQKKLAGFAEKGRNKGVVLVGLFGHGVEFESTRKSYFCPYNTSVKAKRDANGRAFLNDNGQPRMEPDADRLISIDDILLALRESKTTNRILLADCCRNDPNAARGRSFGTSLEINQLPQNTAVLFACSAQEKAFEHKDWGHGAFTKCLLDAIKENATRGKSLMGSIAEDVEPAVEKLVASKIDATQRPRLLSTGARIDLQLVSSLLPKPSPVAIKTTLPPSSSLLSPSPLRATLETIRPGASSLLSPLPSSIYFHSNTSSLEATQTMSNGGSRAFEGTKAGDAKELVPGIAFRWCPPGTLTMGEDSDKVEVQLSSGFWLEETEVTQGQWQKLMGTTPWKGKEYVKDGNDYAASYISHEDAVEFFQKLTKQEQSSGRLAKGWKYSLPTEAQWEYACRASTKTRFSFGDDESQLGEYGWFTTNAGDIGEQYAHQVGKRKPNAWGLLDMHGNVWEWCSDRYVSNLSGARAPSGSDKVLRGGSWYYRAVYCRSASRISEWSSKRDFHLGFRLAAVPE